MDAEKYFGTRDLYQILQLNSNAEIQDGKINAIAICTSELIFVHLIIAVKKSYYRLAKLYHPDCNDTANEEEAKAKFNIIHNAYSILSDEAKKKLYDVGSKVLFTKATIAAKWENFLVEVNEKDIGISRKRYQGSQDEENDIIREFVIGKGSLTHLLNNIPFMRREDENRIIEIVKELIENKKVPNIAMKKIRK